MGSHDDIWAVVDALAQSNGLSASALARKAGLDPTTFNKSKRFGPDGRPRWPSTESLAKAMEATGGKLADIIATDFLQPRPGEEIPDVQYAQAVHVPLIGMDKAGASGFFDDGGFPAGSGWDEVPFPGETTERLCALEITGDDRGALYRPGDIVIVAPSAEVRRGDRVVVRTNSGAVMARTLLRHTRLTIELDDGGPDYGTTVLRTDDVAWMARIVWASQ